MSEIAWTYKVKNDLYNARIYADTVLKKKPTDTIACYCKGLALLPTDRPNALAFLMNAANGEIYLPEIYIQIIEVLLEEGKIEDALAYADLAIMYDPNDPVLYVLKGKSLDKLKLYVYEHACYLVSDVFATKLMKDRSNDMITCGETICALQKHGMVDMVEKCNQIFKKRFKHDGDKQKKDCGLI